MNLPNGQRAVIPYGKLEQYCLNFSHPDGKHKAKVFKTALGITQDSSYKLKELILESAVKGFVKQHTETIYGNLFRVEHAVSGVTRNEVLCTLWIIRPGESLPYLTSCYIKTRKAE